MKGKLTNSLLNLHKLKYLNLAYNKLQGPLSDSSEWIFLKDLQFIEIQSNRISGTIPAFWRYLSKLEYVDVGYNNFTGQIPIFEAAQDLKGVDFSDNMFSGAYPREYFDKTRWKKLEFINANFNQEIIVPEFCIRYAFCFKSKFYRTHPSSYRNVKRGKIWQPLHFCGRSPQKDVDEHFNRLRP